MVKKTTQLNSVDMVADMQNNVVNLEIDKPIESGRRKGKKVVFADLSDCATIKNSTNSEKADEVKSINQQIKKFEINDGAKIETDEVRKKRKKIENTVKNNLAKSSGEKSNGEKNVATNEKATLNSGEELSNLTKESAVKELEKGVSVAVRVLVKMMTDETATNALKVDCAKEILNRIYGKTFEKANDACEIEISEDLKGYCE